MERGALPSALGGSKADGRSEGNVDTSVGQSILGRVSTSAWFSSPLTLFPIASFRSFYLFLSFPLPFSLFLFLFFTFSSPFLLFHFIPLHVVAALVTSSSSSSSCFFSRAVRTYLRIYVLLACSTYVFTYVYTYVPM